MPAPTCTQRGVLYRRLNDGMTVQCGDWSDGDTSWLFNPMPIVSDRHIVGTMSTEKFDRLHEPTEQPI